MEMFDFIVTATSSLAKKELLSNMLKQGIIVTTIYRHIDTMIVIHTTWDKIAELRNDYRVLDIELDKSHSIHYDIANPRNWGLDRIDQRTLPLTKSYTATRTGVGANIYIIDTGVDSDHPEFTNRAIGIWDYRAAILVGTATGYVRVNFPRCVDSFAIASTINETIGENIASVEFGKIKLTMGQYKVVNAGDSFPNFMENTIGIQSGSTGTVIGTIINPSITINTVPRYGEDDHNHGTHVASIAGGASFGVAPSATILSVKCFSSTAQALTSTIISALDYIIDHHMTNNHTLSVANLSFGGSKSVAMDHVVLTMMQRGILCCVAAGNSAMNAYNFSPAGAGATLVTVYQKDEAGTLVLENGNPIIVSEGYDFDQHKPITVGACNAIDQFANFSNFSDENATLAGSASSNYGSVVDIIAPGVNIIGAKRGERNTNYGMVYSGTSQATPHVAGVAALFLADNFADTTTIKERILEVSTRGVIAFTSGHSNAIDVTPNRLLYMPFSASDFIWISNTHLGEFVENSPIATKVVAKSVDTNGNPLTVKYNTTPTKPILGTVADLGGGLWLICDTGEIIGTAPNVTTNTIITCTIWVVDDRGNVLDGHFNVSILNKNIAPNWVTTQEELPIAIENTNYSFTLVAHDPDGTAITYGLLSGSLPPGIRITSDGELLGIPTPLGVDKTFRFVVRATDGDAVVDRTFSISVIADNQPPKWVSNWLPIPVNRDGLQVHPLGKFNLGDLVNISLMADDIDNDPITFNLIDIHNQLGLPQGLVFDNGKISGVISPFNQDGSYVFGVGITDAAHPTQNIIYFCVDVLDAVEITQIIRDIHFDKNNNPMVIATINGGSRIIKVTTQVTSAFNGIIPKCAIGDSTNSTKLMGYDVTKLSELGEYHSYPNVKYNQPGNVDVYLNFSDNSYQPQYKVHLRNTSIIDVEIIDPGNGYTVAPKPEFRFGGGSGADAVTTLTAVNAELDNPGYGYAIGDLLIVPGGDSRNNQVTIVVTGIDTMGAIKSFDLVSNGIYLSTPINPAPTVGGNGTGATFNINYGVGSVMVIKGGNGYLSLPQVIFDGNGITTGTLQVQIEYEKSDIAVFFGNIKWETPSGVIGEIMETDKSYHQVIARASGGNSVSYSLAPGSGPLPLGLSLNATGEIVGECGYTHFTTTYYFTVRASVGTSFVDRTFALVHKSIFHNKQTCEVSMAVTGYDRMAWANYVDTVIPANSVYRPLDPLYSVVYHPSMLVCSGLQDTNAEAFWRALSGNPDRPHEYDYHRDINLCVGDVKYAVARDDHGKIVYEVVYREIIEPLSHIYTRKGGTYAVAPNGFTTGTSPIRIPTPYPQMASPYNTSGIQYIYPSSIYNMRNDLAANDSGGIGSSGYELLPLWMRCEQVSGKPETIIGYIPAIVMAYVKPGEGLTITKNAALNDDSLAGTKLKFDRYVLTRYITNELIFDDGIVFPAPEQYQVIATKSPYDTSIHAYTPQEVYHYTNGILDYAETINDMETNARIRANESGRQTPTLNQDWLLSDYRPHENPNGDTMVLDGETTVFDYTIVRVNQFFKFPPGDKKP